MKMLVLKFMSSFIFILVTSLLLIQQNHSILAQDCSDYDLNGDGEVNALDSQQVAFHVNAPYDPTYDLDGDNDVDTDDVIIVGNCILASGPNIEMFPLPAGPEGLDPSFTEENLIGQIISKILPIILGIIGFITVIIIIISGIQFITSSGNPEAAGAARSRLTLAIVGFVIVVLAFAITQIIDKIFLGTGGTEFQVF